MLEWVRLVTMVEVVDQDLQIKSSYGKSQIIIYSTVLQYELILIKQIKGGGRRENLQIRTSMENFVGIYL